MLYEILDNDKPFYCLDLKNIVTKSNKNRKINHIIIVDNYNINDKAILNEIKFSCPMILDKYCEYVTFENVCLITTYPKLQAVYLSHDEVYGEFLKISYSDEGIMCEDNHMSMIVEECLKYIVDGSANEILMFTDLSHVYNLKGVFDKLTQYIFSMVANETIECVNTFEIHTIDAYRTFFNCRDLCNDADPNGNIKVDFGDGHIYGTNTNMLTFGNSYDIIPIDKKINSILINDISYDIIDMGEKKKDDILNMLSFVLHNHSELEINDDIKNYKSILLHFINSNLKERGKAMSLYNKYQIIYNDYLGKKISNMDVGIVDNVNMSETIGDISIDFQNNNITPIIEYGKKALIYNNKNFAIPKFDKVNVDKFVELHDNCADSMFVESMKLFESSITLSGWYDEVKSGSCMGILFNFEASDLSKKGVHGFGTIGEITSTFMPVTDFINNANEIFEKGNVTWGNLNNISIVEDSIIGCPNAILPVYIHKQHWKVAKTYLHPILGLIHSHNPFTYVKAYNNIYYPVFIKITSSLFCNKESLNSKFVRTYFSFFRTCSEICFENKYNFGIKTLMGAYMDNPINRISKSYLEFDKLFVQILTTGYMDIDITTFLIYLVEEDIRLCVRNKKYTMAYINDLRNKDNLNMEEEGNKLICDIYAGMHETLQIFVAWYRIMSIFKGMIEICGTYGQFIKRLDKNYGVLDEELVKYTIDNVVGIDDYKHISFEEFYGFIGAQYDKNKIIMYILQGIRCCNNKVKEMYINDGRYIDIFGKSIDDAFIIDYVRL
jgi:hypothetical protein